MRRRHLVIVAVLVALALGAVAGYLYRRWRAPTIEERARDVLEDLRRGAEKLKR